MIIQLTGKVKYPLTLDPTVWIFDDRKVTFEQAFESKDVVSEIDEGKELKKASERWNQEIYQQRVKPPVNKSINRYQKEQILNGTFLMPIYDFIATSEINEEAEQAKLILMNEESISISINQLENAYLLFAENGKPVKENGPVHLFFRDGSNREEPIQGITKIIVE
ncbi:hypothetical protein [Sediminibacillus massiliensis]|uniref:hypothetical protein n=1 Tax=Sediminibacillus massiliensis TaxID=1926277 RepID=UPI0009885C88|nr:hypothetical protein [Sediminibacillus massiliensis]